MTSRLVRPILIAGLAVAVFTAAIAQQAPPQTPPAQQPPPVIPGMAQPPAPQTPPAAPPQGVIPGMAQPAAAPASPASPASPAPTTQPATAPAQPARGLDFELPNGSLTDFIEIVAKRLHINYVLDPAVASRGSVSLFTYGEAKPTDLMTLLQTILRVNGATIVQVGDLYRIIPINKISSLPIDPMVNVDQKTLPEDERMVLDLIFLKYSTAAEIEKLIVPFLGEGASHSIYEAANLLILQDNARNMKRTLKLIDMFDSESFAGQRVKLFDVNNSRPSDLVKELDNVFKAYAMSEKSSAVKFIPVDRINVIIGVAPNPGIFPQVQSWIDKLDIAVKVQAGEVSTYVYRMKYGRAVTTAAAIMALYTGNVGALMSLEMMMANSSGMGGGGGYGGMNNGFGGGGYGGGGYGGGGYGGGGYGMGAYGMGGNYGGYNNGYGSGYQSSPSIPPISIAQGGSAIASPTAGPNTPDLTGAALAAGAGAGTEWPANSTHCSKPVRQQFADPGHAARVAANQ